AIATTRTQEEAWALAHQLHDAVSKADFGQEDLRVEMAIGIAGGKRHIPRPGSYSYANVDDLINWASRASTRAKTEPGHVVAFKGTGSEGPEFATLPDGAESGAAYATLPSHSPRIRFEEYSISHTGPGMEVTVHLGRGEETHSATATDLGGEI